MAKDEPKIPTVIIVPAITDQGRASSASIKALFQSDLRIQLIAGMYT